MLQSNRSDLRIGARIETSCPRFTPHFERIAPIFGSERGLKQGARQITNIGADRSDLRIGARIETTGEPVFLSPCKIAPIFGSERGLKLPN